MTVQKWRILNPSVLYRGDVTATISKKRIDLMVTIHVTFFIPIAGIETERQDQMNKSGRSGFLEKEYDQSLVYVVFITLRVRVCMTHGYVPWINSKVPKEKSSGDVLSRIEKFFAFFGPLVYKVKVQNLLNAQKVHSETIFTYIWTRLYTTTQQRLDWDFDPNTVQSLIVNKNYDGVSVPVWSYFAPRGSSLMVQTRRTEAVKTVSMDFGDWGHHRVRGWPRSHW